MAVQLEIKEQLAKLLATEDIVVEHKQVSSAQFNVHTRVLVLPLWEKASNAVYDMLVGHEVGHALFTPDEDPPEDVPHQFVNVVEDARIEKLMKRKYMGLAKSFYKGYKELYDEDFFELDGEDITTFNLADRANLYFKVGNFLNLDFLPAEKEIIDMISRCETFEDTLKAAYVLYQYCLEPEKEEIESKFIEPDSGEGEGFGDQFFDEGSEKGETYEETPTQTGNEEPEVKTAESLDSKLQDLVNEGGVENIYLEVPKVNLDTVIVSNSDVHENIDKHFKFQFQQSEKNCFKEPDSEFLKFKKESQKEVNYLVKEFECRKAASSYSRSATSRTGILNTEKLSSYRFNEDLFKRVVKAAEGAALGTETQMSFEVIHGNYSLMPNDALQRIMYKELSDLGGISYTEEEKEYATKLHDTLLDPKSKIGDQINIAPYKPRHGYGSTDVGDISWLVPTAGARIATWVPGTPAHSWQAVAAGGTTIGLKGTKLASQVLTHTAIAIFLNPSIVNVAKDELKERVGNNFDYFPLLGNRKPPLDYRN